jgi:hemerythrin
MALVWTNEMNTGIDVIDSQHMRIVEYINQLEKAARRQDQQLVGQVLGELVDYTLSHFAFEESLQEEAGYAFAKPHKSVHDTFVKRIAKYQERHDAGENVVKQVHDALCTWLMHHIKRDDMAYVRDVKASLAKKAREGKDGGWLGRTIGRFFK